MNGSVGTASRRADRHAPQATRSLLLGACLALSVGGCAQAAASREPPPPAFLLGEFTDDYGATHAISPTAWVHGGARYHIRRWHPAEHYLIAQNDSGNRYAPGKWSRIDWVELETMPPFQWAYCMSAYEAPSADSAARTLIARPDTPRTGCNGHPFTRMRR